MIHDPQLAHAVHFVFEVLAMSTGAQAYFFLRRRAGVPTLPAGAGFTVLVGCLLGAALGNKLAFWLEMPHLLQDAQGMQLLLAGQSMVGGLLGGLVGTELAKLACGQRQSTGDLFVFPLLLALVIGRIGCFLAGVHDGTHGLPSDLPWALDAGDGIPRHPAPLYEILFCGLLAAALWRLQPRCAANPGLLFRLFLSAYLLWRLAVDGLKPVPYPYPLGLSGLQWLCLAALLLYLPTTVTRWRRLHHVPQDPSLSLP